MTTDNTCVQNMASMLLTFDTPHFEMSPSNDSSFLSNGGGGEQTYTHVNRQTGSQTDRYQTGKTASTTETMCTHVL